MANQMKEDEKNEKIIRGLLKLPANRRCINCNSLGPQYVCINFWTFVCTNCSGVHREFTHRVKSISMAKFTSPEISALQGGGNERAKEIYFKEWDQQRHSLPDSSNIRRLRDFIKHVYLDKMYTGEKSPDKNTTMRMGNKTNLYEGKDTCQIGYGSPHYKDTVERNLTERFNSTKQPEDRRYNYNSNGRGSPRYDQNIRHGYRRSTVHFEVVDDRYRDDTTGKGRRSEQRKFPVGEPKLEIKSSNNQKDLNKSRAPVIRSVKDILGDDVPPLCVSESPKANGGKNTSDSLQLEKNASSNSLGSSCEKSVVLKRENSGSLINFDIDPIPSYESTELLAQPTAAPSSQYITKSTINNQSIDNNNRGSSDFNVEGNVLFSGQKPTNSPTLESLLFQLSTPVTTPIEPITPINSELVTTPKSTPNSIGELCGPPNNKTGSVSLKQNTERSLTTKFPEQTSQVSPHGNQVPYLFDIHIDNQSTTSKLNPSIGWAPSNQSSTLAQNAQGTSTTSFGQSSQIVSQDMSGETVESQLALRQTNFGERKALPEDLFTATYSSVSMSVPSWHAGPINSNSFGAQYPSDEQKATTFHHSKSMNPFDLNDEPVLVHAPTMSSMATLQGALPNIEAHQGLLRSSSFGTANAKWMASQPPSYGATPQSPSYGVATESPSSYASTMSPNAYMGAQQVSRNMQGYGHADDCRIVGCQPSWDMRHQGFGGQGNGESFYMTLNKQQPPTSRSSLSTTLNSFASQGGNPFG